MTYTTPPLSPFKAQRYVERADQSTRSMLRSALYLNPDVADSLRQRESRRMERAWGRICERWEEAALRSAAAGQQSLQWIAQQHAKAAYAKSVDWRRFGAGGS